jgi:hypothetical protein
MTQEVSRRTLTAEARIRDRVRSFGMCDGQSGQSICLIKGRMHRRIHTQQSHRVVSLPSPSLVYTGYLLKYF